MTFFLWGLIYSFGGDGMKRFVARKRYNFRFIKVTVRIVVNVMIEPIFKPGTVYLKVI